MPEAIDLRYRIVDDEGAIDGMDVLSPDERARADRFVFERDRAIFIAAHVLLRRMLSERGGLPPEEWTFVESALGKPSLDPRHGDTRLSFNIAHTRGLVACAVGRDATIGIDVEGIRTGAMAIDIAGRFFSAAERAALVACPPDERPARFTGIWTLKEAYIKAVGQGLSHPLDTFSFAIDGDRLTFAPPAGDTAPWRIALFAPTPQHRMAIAIASANAVPIEARHDGEADLLTPLCACEMSPG